FYLGYWGVVGVFFPFLNVHFARMGLSGREIGLFAAPFPLATLLVAPAISAFADRRQARMRVLAVALPCFALTLMLIGVAHSFAVLLPLMILFALSRCPIAPVADSMVARMAVRHRLEFGRMRLWGSLGFAVFAVAAGALWERVGFEYTFLLAGLLFLPVAFLVGGLEEGEPVQRDVQRPLGELGRDTGLLVLLASTFLMGAALGSDFVFSGIYMKELGGSDLMVGAIFGLAALGELPGMLYGDAVARRLQAPATLVLAYGLMAVSYVGYVLTPDPLLLLVVGFLKGAGFGLFFVNAVRLLHERTPPEWSSTAQAIMHATAFGLAQLVSGPLGGVLYDAWSARAVFVACALYVALAAVLIFLGGLQGIFERPVAPSGASTEAATEPT
ncbi:MAG: MFS transporter, partial [Chloroflexota bacterium]|nr:MFS transporter [Chloroflexota bacterium]